jgi:hypothetical protein
LGVPHNECTRFATRSPAKPAISCAPLPGPAIALRAVIYKTQTCLEGQMEFSEIETQPDLELDPTIWEGLDQWLSPWVGEA